MLKHPLHIDNVNTKRASFTTRNRYSLVNCRAFSLLELLAVLLVIVILSAVAAPSLMQIANTAGRKGAVNVILNAFEQARVSALTSGTNAYVGFADDNFPDANLQYRAFIIFRSSTSDDPASAGNYIALTKWETLPKNISFKSENNSIVAAYTLSLTDDSLPKLSSGTSLPCIVFNSTGAIQQPTNSNMLQLFIYEGFFSNGQDNFTRSAQSSATALFERITFSRFTGRAHLDVTTL